MRYWYSNFFLETYGYLMSMINDTHPKVVNDYRRRIATKLDNQMPQGLTGICDE